MNKTKQKPLEILQEIEKYPHRPIKYISGYLSRRPLSPQELATKFPRVCVFYAGKQYDGDAIKLFMRDCSRRKLKSSRLFITVTNKKPRLV